MRSSTRRWLDDALWGPETAARLVVVHTGLAVLIGLRVALGSYRHLADTPPILVDPVPLLWWLARMPPAGLLIALQVVGSLAAFAAALRWRTRWLFAIAWVCYLLLAALRGSRGKVLHNDLLLLWASVPFLLAAVTGPARNLRTASRDRVARRAFGWPVRVATVIIVLVYLFAGYHKLRRSGPAWVLGDHMRYVMLWGPRIGSPVWADLTVWIGEHLWVARAMAALILGIELTFPVVLFVRRLRPVYAVIVSAIHVGTWLLLGLDYWAWAFTVPLVLIDWSRLRLPRRVCSLALHPTHSVQPAVKRVNRSAKVRRSSADQPTMRSAMWAWRTSCSTSKTR